MLKKTSSSCSALGGNRPSQTDAVQPESITDAFAGYRLDIPAVDFCQNTPKRANPTPPSRLLRPTSSVSSAHARRKRQNTAATARATAMRMRRAHCHQQTLHAATVARTVRDARLRTSTQRRISTRDQLSKAAQRKSLLLNSMKDAGAAVAATPLGAPPSSELSRANVSNKAPPISPSSVVTAAASHSLDAACDIYDERLAARMIAARFLLSRSRRVLRHVGLLGTAITSASFDSIAARIQTTPALAGARLALRAIDIFLSTGSTTADTSSRKPINFRILLSALLVAAHPSVLTNSPLPALTGVARTTSDDADVIAKARALALAVHTSCVSVLVYAWQSWRPSFMAWKARDRPLLVDSLIASALATAEKKRAASGLMSALTDVADMHERLTGDSHTEGLDAENFGKHDAWLADVRRAVAAVGGPDGVKQLDDALERAERQRGERLLHEVLIDPQELAAALCSTTIVPSDAWERMHQQLSETPSQLSETSTRLAFVRKMLISLGADVAKTQWPSIGQAGRLDAEFVRAVVDTVAAGCLQCQAEVFDAGVHRWADSAKSQIRQAAMGDEPEANSLAQIAVDTLMQATELVSGVYAHIVLWRVQRAASNVATYGIMWERTQFAQHVAKGEVTVKRSKEWLRKSRDEVARNAGKSDAEESCNLIWEGVTQGILNLTSPVTNANLGPVSRLDEDTVPEVLMMDVQRLRRISYDIRRCATVSALYHTVKAYGTRSGVHVEGVEQWAERVAEASEGDDFEKTVDKWMSEFEDTKGARSQLKTNINVLKGIVCRVASGNDETFRLMVRRICRVVFVECVRRRTHWASSSSSSGETEISKEALKQAGLPAVGQSVEAISSQVHRLVRHTVTVHGERLFLLSNGEESEAKRDG